AASFPYALRTLVDEVTLRPVVVEDGAPVEIDPLSSGGEVDFGDPIGSGETIYTLHSELRTFPESFGCQKASFRLSLSGPVLKALRRLASASEQELDEAARVARPPPPTRPPRTGGRRPPANRRLAGAPARRRPSRWGWVAG